MSESIESFVKKLQSEGVDAGKEAAEKIQKEAKLQAERIVADAEVEAKKILERAEDEARKKLSRAGTEVELAVRDGVLKLRESLDRVLSALLARRVEEKLSDPDYMGDIVREVVAAYAKADAERQTPIEIHMPREIRDKLNEGVLNDLRRYLGGERDNPAVRATLERAGFEYKIQGATVEVSPDSVSELLREMVSPTLQEIMDRAAEAPDRNASGEEITERNEELPVGDRKKTDQRPVAPEDMN